MMFRKFLILGILAGALSALVSGIFAYMFNQNLLDFSEVLPYRKIIAVDFSLALVSVGLFYGLSLISKKYFKVFFNSLFSLCSIASVLVPITAKFPDLEFPEFYPTLAIPLHLIFSVVFLALSSILIQDEK
jgi:hypothetical protein